MCGLQPGVQNCLSYSRIINHSVRPSLPPPPPPFFLSFPPKKPHCTPASPHTSMHMHTSHHQSITRTCTHTHTHHQSITSHHITHTISPSHELAHTHTHTHHMHARTHASSPGKKLDDSGGTLCCAKILGLGGVQVSDYSRKETARRGGETPKPWALQRLSSESFPLWYRIQRQVVIISRLLVPSPADVNAINRPQTAVKSPLSSLPRSTTPHSGSLLWLLLQRIHFSSPNLLL